jgi:hypothetical protein
MAAAVSAVMKKPVERRIDTGVVVVTRANLQSPEVQDMLRAGARPALD